jgi:hypothetical protein
MVGWRVGKAIEALPINLHVDTFSVLEKVAGDALARLSNSRGRPYEASSALEVGEEHYLIDITQLPAGLGSELPATGLEHSAAAELEIEPTPAALMVALGNVAEAVPLSADRLENGNFLFYGISYGSGADKVTFLRKHDPTLSLRRGFAVFAYGDSLKRISKPDFVLEEDIDLIVTAKTIFAFSKTAFEMFMSDVRLALHQVPLLAEAVATSLQHTVPLGSEAKAAVSAVCSKSLSFAVRLRSLPARIAEVDLTSEKVRASMGSHGEDASRLVDENGIFNFGEAEVATFLDVVEGRWFEDDFTKEKRRADRLSRR